MSSLEWAALRQRNCTAAGGFGDPPLESGVAQRPAAVGGFAQRVDECRIERGSEECTIFLLSLCSGSAGATIERMIFDQDVDRAMRMRMPAPPAVVARVTRQARAHRVEFDLTAG
jgi:hypothetical protein